MQTTSWDEAGGKRLQQTVIVLDVKGSEVGVSGFAIGETVRYLGTYTETPE